jgi:G3E family GTPase
MRHKINATLITGYLGSGKTTFINNLLKKYPEKQFALVENEFGEVSIDSRLVKGVNASHLFELKNGCICCTITNEYELALTELADRFPEVDELLIETTGIADPPMVIQPFTSNPEIIERYNFQGIVCLVDAKHFSYQFKLPVARRQMMVAGSCIISKIDPVDATEKSRMLEMTRQHNSLSTCFFSSREETEFELGNYWSNPPGILSRVSIYEPLGHKGLKSLTFRISEPMEPDAFREWLVYFLGVYRNRIYRIKGIVYFRDEPFEYIVQSVGQSWEITEGSLSVENQEGILVFIGELDGVSFEGSPFV